MQIVLDTDQCQLYFHEDKGIVHHHLNFSVNEKNLRLLFNQGTALLKTHQAHKWLSDDQDISLYQAQNTDWTHIEDMWVNQAVAAGWKYWALVVSPKILADGNIQNLVVLVNQNGVQVRIFHDVWAAMTWLKTVDQVPLAGGGAIDNVVSNVIW